MIVEILGFGAFILAGLFGCLLIDIDRVRDEKKKKLDQEKLELRLKSLGLPPRIPS